MQISVSELKKYLRCPRSYKISEIDGAEPEKTSLSHCQNQAVRKILHILHDEPTLCEEHLSEKIWQEEIQNVSESELNTLVVQPKPATKTKPAIPGVTKSEKMLENIKVWMNEYVKEEIELVYSNVYFQVPIADVTFVGYIDAIRKNDDGFEILIFNTSPQSPDTSFLEHDFITSLLSYALWKGRLFHSYPNLEDSVELKTLPKVSVYHLPSLERYQKKVRKHKKGDRKGDPLIDVTRTKEQLLEFEYEILYTISGIEQEFFPKMPRNPVGCSICPYVKYCHESKIFKNSVDVSFDVENFEEEVFI